MSTRSNIAIERKNKTVEVVYCHWDGYLSNNGQILLDNYKDIDKINNLILKGDISSLGENIEDCNFYEDENYSAIFFKSLDEYLKQVDTLWIEYIYIFSESEGKWYYIETNDNWKFKKPVTKEQLKLLTQEEIKKSEE